MRKNITKKVAKERATEFWKYFWYSNYEALCFKDNGLSWQIRCLEDDETFVISVEDYSEEHSEWHSLKDVADIIYDFVNR